MDNTEEGNLIVNTTRITVRPEHRKELCQTISSLIDLIKSEKGCLAYRFYQEAGDENSFILVGEWESRADWDNYLHSDDFAVLLGSIMILGSRSDTDFKLLSPVAGMETVTRARMQ